MEMSKGGQRESADWKKKGVSSEAAEKWETIALVGWKGLSAAAALKRRPVNLGVRRRSVGGKGMKPTHRY